MKQAVYNILPGNVASFFFLISKVRSAATEMPFLLVFCPAVQIHGSVFILMVGIFLSQSFLLFKIRQLRRWGYLTAWENPVCYTHRWSHSSHPGAHSTCNQTAPAAAAVGLCLVSPAVPDLALAEELELHGTIPTLVVRVELIKSHARLGLAPCVWFVVPVLGTLVDAVTVWMQEQLSRNRIKSHLHTRPRSVLSVLNSDWVCTGL